MPAADSDLTVRLKAFAWLNEQVAAHGDVLPRTLLQAGFNHNGIRVPLMSPQGIFTPRVLSLPLSITTAPRGPYDDSIGDDGALMYKYRGADAQHPDNVGLRQLMLQQIPLVYFHGLVPGRYFASFPTYIVGDDPGTLTFKAVVDDFTMIQQSASLGAADQSEIRRSYVTVMVQQRLHQRKFRERVLQAYKEQCSVCRLRHYELLDAAHIMPDAQPQGIAAIQNGLSLCKLHHAAFDASFLGITPEYTVKINERLLLEQDGPMLTHGIQALHDSPIVLPSSIAARPDKELLDYRYQKFLAS